MILWLQNMHTIQCDMLFVGVSAHVDTKINIPFEYPVSFIYSEIISEHHRLHKALAKEFQGEG